jgi:hypothetical protein
MMTPPTLPIYHHNHHEPQQGPLVRLVCGLLAVACMAVLFVATTILPDPSGTGTHKQLGMAPCSLLMTSGVPCMTCGMTTSYSHFVRGNILASLWTQPGGTLLAFLTACGVWVFGYVALTGLPGAGLVNRLPLGRFIFIVLGFLLLAWTYKVVMTVRGW